MGNLTEINQSNFDEMVLKKQGKVLVDFWAPWCGPCRMLTPVLENVSKSDKINASICKVNTDENQELAVKYGIQSIPTLIIFENGEVKETLMGVQPEEVIISKLQ